MKRLVPLFLLAACGAPEPEGARLQVLVVGESTTPGPLAERLADEMTAATLVSRDESGQLVTGLASSWRFVDDGKSLILRLRPLKWADGKPLESAQVVAALKKRPALRAAGLAAPGAIRAPIARVVELRLAAASPLLLGWLAEPALAVTRKGLSLAEYSRSDERGRIVLKRWSETATPAAQPAEVVIAATGSAGDAVAGFARGDSDIVIGEGLAGLGEARSSTKRQALRIDPLWGVYGYLANGLKGPLANPDLRRALSLVVDRANLTDTYGIQAMVPVTGLLPPSLHPQAKPATEEIADTSAIIDTARQIVAANTAGDAPLRLVLLLPPGREHRVVAEQVAASWSRVGVQLVVSEADAATRARLIKRGDFDLTVSEASVPVPDAGALLARYRCGAGPHCNKVADTLLDAAAAADPLARPRLLATAEQALMDGPPLIGLFAPVRWALVSPQVSGWTPNVAASHPLARMRVDGRRRR